MKPIRIPSSPAKRIRIFLLAICILAMLWGLWHTMKFYIIPEVRAAWQANLLSRENPFLTYEPGTHKLFDISPEDVEELGQVYGGKMAVFRDREEIEQICALLNSFRYYAWKKAPANRELPCGFGPLLFVHGPWVTQKRFPHLKEREDLGFASIQSAQGRVLVNGFWYYGDITCLRQVDEWAVSRYRYVTDYD